MQALSLNLTAEWYNIFCALTAPTTPALLPSNGVVVFRGQPPLIHLHFSFFSLSNDYLNRRRIA
jgi:hypothetical protein